MDGAAEDVVTDVTGVVSVVEGTLVAEVICVGTEESALLAVGETSDEA